MFNLVLGSPGDGVTWLFWFLLKNKHFPMSVAPFQPILWGVVSPFAVRDYPVLHVVMS